MRFFWLFGCQLFNRSGWKRNWEITLKWNIFERKWWWLNFFFKNKFKSPEGTCVSFSVDFYNFPIPPIIIVSSLSLFDNFSLCSRIGNDSTARNLASRRCLQLTFSPKINQNNAFITYFCTHCSPMSCSRCNKSWKSADKFAFIFTNGRNMKIELEICIGELLPLLPRPVSTKPLSCACLSFLCTLSFNCSALIMKIVREISHEFLLLCIKMWTVPRGSGWRFFSMSNNAGAV